jgi:hypothetical protein
MKNLTHVGTRKLLAACALVALTAAESACLQGESGGTPSSLGDSSQASFAVPVTASPGGGACGRSAKSDGWSMRVDRVSDGVVVSPPFAEPVKLVARDGAYVPESSQLELDASTSSDIQLESWSRLSLDFAAASGSGQGRMDYGADIASSCDLSASIALANDVTPPKLTARSPDLFASAVLPWEPRTLEASEPYEGTMDTSALFGASAPRPTFTPLTTHAFAPAKERGVVMFLGDWDRAPSLTVTTPVVVDPSGNASAPTTVQFGGATVAARASASLAWPLVGAAPFTWGGAASTDGCETGETCFRIHAERFPCDSGSIGGLATRLSPGRTLHVRLRAMGTRSLIQMAVPGRAPQFLDAPSVQKGADSGWIDVRAPIPDGAPEVGIAISAGGTGAAISAYGKGWCFSSDATDETLLVERIETLP